MENRNLSFEKKKSDVWDWDWKNHFEISFGSRGGVVVEYFCFVIVMIINWKPQFVYQGQLLIKGFHFWY